MRTQRGAFFFGCDRWDPAFGVPPTITGSQLANDLSYHSKGSQFARLSARSAHVRLRFGLQGLLPLRLERRHKISRSRFLKPPLSNMRGGSLRCFSKCTILGDHICVQSTRQRSSR